ncbi:MAG: hypothetical protein CMD34_06585 [Flavobacteriales bacterium]|nr:hypothetical protein [Flavobacteriales bacterium]MBO98539.1 hypothetical protein [Flavobacteriales bacterium]|tara:strand:- start:3801 stop:4394 length:594 start_codon:yes stop_codon:yes gene_type:complete
MNIIDILTASLTLFAVIDMPGNIPLIIRLRKEYGEIQSIKSTCIAAFIMISFLFFGNFLFTLLGIELFHFALAGSFLIIYFGIKMVLGLESKSPNQKISSATIFPIAFPLIAGPGTLSTLIALNSEISKLELVLAILINCIVIYIFLKSATWIQRKIGLTGIIIIERIFGIILIAIGMKLLLKSLILSINFALATVN